MLWSSSSAGSGHPAKALLGRAVVGTYSRPTDPHSRSPRARRTGTEVDLARPRLAAAGGVGDLHVRDPVAVAADRVGEVALHALHVEDVVLEPTFGSPTRSIKRDGVVSMADQVGAVVERVDGLDEDLTPRSRRRVAASRGSRRRARAAHAVRAGQPTPTSALSCRHPAARRARARPAGWRGTCVGGRGR